MSRLCLSLLITAALLATNLYAASPPADKIFPETTKGFAAIQNLKVFGDQWKQTQFGKLLDDPLMENFKKELQKQLTDRMEETFGLTLDGISTLPSGEVAVGMIAIPNRIPGYVLTMDVAGKRTETDKYLADLTQKLVGAGVVKTTEIYKEQQITILTFPPPKVETPRQLGNTRIEITVEPIERKAYYMFFQDVLIASDQLHLLKLIADRIAGPVSRSLADIEAYQVTMRRCIADIPNQTPPLIRWYIEPFDYGESVRTLLRGPVVQNRREKPSIFSIMKQHGFDAIQGIGGVVTVKSEAQESVSRTFVYTKKPYRLSMRMLNLPDSTNFAPPTWMPADLARCTMVYVDPMAIFDNIGPLADAFIDEEGVWNDILEGLKTDNYGPKIDIREEIIAHLGNRVLGMSRYAKPITAESESLVVAVELKPERDAAIIAAADKLFSTDDEMETLQYKTHKIWQRKPRTVADGKPNLVETILTAQRSLLDDDEPRPLFFPEGGVTVAKGFLFVASNIDYLNVILDRLDAPAESAVSAIVNVAEYQTVNTVFAAMGMADRPHFAQVFARPHETLRPTYEQIRQGRISESQTVAGKLLNILFPPEDETGVRRQVLNGASLPEFDRIQHYFGSVGFFGITEANGYFIKGFAVER